MVVFTGKDDFFSADDDDLDDDDLDQNLTKEEGFTMEEKQDLLEEENEKIREKLIREIMVAHDCDYQQAGLMAATEQPELFKDAFN